MRTLFLALALVFAATAAAEPTAPILVATPRPHTWLVLRDHPGGRALTVLHRTTMFGSRVKLGVAEVRGAWLGVISERLPNGVVGWVPRRDMTLLRIHWSVDVSLSKRTLTIRHDGEVVRRVRVAIGTPSSPTPPGLYAITDHVNAKRWGGTYGCCLVVLSGHQTHLPAGYDPTRHWRIAIHGGGGIGGAASAGCVHADDTTLWLLMRRTPLGTPVTIAR